MKDQKNTFPYKNNNCSGFLPLIEGNGNIFILLNDSYIHGENILFNHTQDTSEVYRHNGNIEHDRKGEKRTKKAQSTQLYYSYDIGTNWHESKRTCQPTQTGHNTNNDNSSSRQRKERSSSAIREGAFISSWFVYGCYETEGQSVYDVCSPGEKYCLQVCTRGDGCSSSYTTSQFCSSLFEERDQYQNITEDPWSYEFEYNSDLFGCCWCGCSGGFWEGDLVMDDDWTCFEFASLNDLPKVSGVYFLMNGVELVYVGQSKNIRSRVGAHHNMWNCTLFAGDEPLEEDTFDSIYYLEVDYKPERKSYEYMFRDDYWPKLNAYDWEHDFYRPMKVKQNEERAREGLLDKIRKGQFP